MPALRSGHLIQAVIAHTVQQLRRPARALPHLTEAGSREGGGRRAHPVIAVNANIDAHGRRNRVPALRARARHVERAVLHHLPVLPQQAVALQRLRGMPPC